MRTRHLPFTASALAAVLGLAGAPVAHAEATPQEAARLQAVGETYFGGPPPGEPGVVAVVPEGDHYRASLDLALLIRRLITSIPDPKARDITIEAAPVSVALAPRDDGVWRFWDYRLGKFVFAFAGQRTELVTDGVTFETIFDPATGASPSMTGGFARISATSTAREPGKSLAITTENTAETIALEGSSRPTATPGVLDLAMQQTVATTRYVFGTTGGTAEGVPDMSLVLTRGRETDVIGLRGYRNAALLDLWAHLVAHHAPADFTTGQGALKAKLAAALPIFEEATQKVEAVDFSFESPFVIAKAEKAALDVDLAGVTREGRFGMAVAVAGFQAWSMFAPKWTQKLMPRDIALAGRVSGYDLATPISAFLDAADFSAQPPLAPEQQARIAALFLPRGTVEVVLDGNHLVGPLYDVTLDGRLTAGPGGAKGAVDVRARGLEKVAEHLATEKDDERARTMAGALAVARGFAERKGEDLVWHFDFEGSAVSVNGRPLK